MRYGTIPKTGVAILVTGMLMACGDRDRNTPTASPITFATPKPSGGQIAGQIGGNFMDRFNAGNTMAPRDPSAADVPPLDPTAAPIDN